MFWYGYIAGVATPLVASAILIMPMWYEEIRSKRRRDKAIREYLANSLEEWEKENGTEPDNR